MQTSRSLNGRIEKRLPIILVVRLSRVEQQPADDGEITYTDNISRLGARVYSASSWTAGEQAQVTSVKDESSIRGEVVYCQRLDTNRFFIGVRFLEQTVKWSALSRYDGL